MWLRRITSLVSEFGAESPKVFVSFINDFLFRLTVIALLPIRILRTDWLAWARHRVEPSQRVFGLHVNDELSFRSLCITE